MSHLALNSSSENYYAGIDRTNIMNRDTTHLLSSLRTRNNPNVGSFTNRNKFRNGGGLFSSMNENAESETLEEENEVNVNGISGLSNTERNIYHEPLRYENEPSYGGSMNKISSRFGSSSNSSSGSDGGVGRRTRRQSVICNRNVEVIKDPSRLSYEVMDHNQEDNRLEFHLSNFGKNRIFVRFNNDEMFDISRLGLFMRAEAMKEHTARSQSSAICDSVVIYFEDKTTLTLDYCTTEMFSKVMDTLTPFIEKGLNNTTNVLLDSYTEESVPVGNRHTSVMMNRGYGGHPGPGQGPIPLNQKNRPQSSSAMHQSSSSKKKEKNKNDKNRVDADMEKGLKKKTSWWKRLRSI